MKVSQEYSDLELRAIKEDLIGEARIRLASAKKNKAAKIAPVSLRESEKLLKEADRFISAHRYESEKMRQKSFAALFQIKRLEQVMAQTTKIDTLSAEDIVLWVENHLHQATLKLQAPDQRDQSWEMQAQNIYQAITALQKNNQQLEKKIEEDRELFKVLMEKK